MACSLHISCNPAGLSLGAAGKGVPGVLSSLPTFHPVFHTAHSTEHIS